MKKNINSLLEFKKDFCEIYEYKKNQKELMIELNELNTELAVWYKIGLEILNHNIDKKENISAYAFRQFMEKMERMNNAHNTYKLKDQVNLLEKKWKYFNKKIDKTKSEHTEITNKFLEHCKKFFEEFNHSRPTSENLVKEIIINGVASNHIPNIQNSKISVWKELKNYFNKVLHNNFEEADIKIKISEFENFLYYMFLPYNNEIYNSLDQFIKKEESQKGIPHISKEIEMQIKANDFTYEYFFNKLNSSKWIEALSHEKMEFFVSLTELFPFAVWLDSDRLDEGWALEQTVEFLKQSKGRIGNNIDYLLDYMINKIKSKTIEVLRCIDWIVRDKNNHQYLAYREKEIYCMLKFGLSHRDQDVVNFTDKIKNKFIALGFHQFRDLN